MSSVRRVYVEKKPDFAVQAKELKHEISSYLGIKTVTAVHVYIRYDVENISEEVFEKACTCVFSEPPVDVLYKEQIPMAEGEPKRFIERLRAQAGQFTDAADVIKVDGLRVEWKDGFALARSSNTTPVVVLRFEGDTPEALKRVKTRFIEVLRSIEPNLVIPE